MNNLLYLLKILPVAVSLKPAHYSLGAYNVDPSSVSISGFSSGGFMTVQLGVAYSDVFTVGFGVFAGGPYDCARNQNVSNVHNAMAAADLDFFQAFEKCMSNNTPSIDKPLANMESWSRNEIANVANLRHRKVYMQTGSADRVIGPNVMGQLGKQLQEFTDTANVIYVTTSGAAHTFPAGFDSRGDNPCNMSESPYISDCDYDGAGAVLQWLYGDLNPHNTGLLTGELIPFAQTGAYGAPGMDHVAYLYLPASCQDSSTVCKLHIVLHGCTQGYSMIGNQFINNTGYIPWADTNGIILIFPQTVADNTVRKVWDGTPRNNSLGCWDWIGQYGNNTDQIGGVQMAAIVNQVKRITSGYKGGSTLRLPDSIICRYLPRTLGYLLSCSK